jgi:site-specific DNA-methyltransferase (adenine-specific)
MTSHRIIQGDCIEGLRTLPDASVHCCVTSPPYWGLRDYGHDGQIGLEATPEAYVARMVEVFREVRRVLREDGTCWVNLGDSYATGAGKVGDRPGGGSQGDNWRGAKTSPNRMAIQGLKPKDLVGIPWRVAFALQADGWWLRQDIIWAKPNPMPESVRDRCTKAHEYVFLLTKSERYFYDAEAVSEAAICDRMRGPALHPDTVSTNGNSGLSRRSFTGTRNRRSVWTVTTKPYSGAHFAVMPPDLVEPCILAGCPEQCCPVCGAGYERITAKQKRFESGSGRSGNAIEGKQDLAASETNSTPDIRMGPVVSVQTLGWAPVCDCAASGTMPGTVLDPFAGSGTTLAVAAELGRSGIGCELNPEYIELASQRIAKSKAKMPLFVA